MNMRINNKIVKYKIMILKKMKTKIQINNK